MVILSQGSDPLSMNDHYEKVFDAISTVHHNKNDKQARRNKVVLVVAQMLEETVGHRKTCAKQHPQASITPHSK